MEVYNLDSHAAVGTVLAQQLFHFDKTFLQSNRKSEATLFGAQAIHAQY